MTGGEDVRTRLSTLPEAVARAFERSVAGADAMPERVILTQFGDMYRRPGGRPLHFSATESLAVDRIAFDWTARIPVAGPLAMTVRDGYDDGEARMRGSLVGVPFMRRSGLELAVGEALRYLAELPWVPYAMLANNQLRWRDLGPRAAEVSAVAAGSPITVRMTADALGDIVSVYCFSRPRSGGRPSGWGGVFSDHGPVGPLRLPRAAEVYWDLPDGRFTYWVATVTDARLVTVADTDRPGGHDLRGGSA